MESRSALLISTTTDVIAVIQPVYVSLTRCQHAQMFLSLFHTNPYRYQYKESVYVSNAQKSSGNEKDLLQIHVSTTWVGRSLTPVRRHYTCAVTKIGVWIRQPSILSLFGVRRVPSVVT